MNVSAFLSGWPFAILLMLYARVGQAPLGGIVVGKDDAKKLVTLEQDGITCPIQIGAATTICGMDGYPVSLEDLELGHNVEVFQ